MFLTINSEGKLDLDRFWGVVTEDAHHVEEVFERQVAVVARREHVTNAIPERIHLQAFEKYVKISRTIHDITGVRHTLSSWSSIIVFLGSFAFFC